MDRVQFGCIGVPEVYVIALDGLSTPRPVSRGGGVEPRWSDDGSRIFFRRGSDVWEVTVRTEPDFAVTGTPTRLFTASIDPANNNNWDVLPDGRFVVVQNAPNVGREVRIMFDWLGRP